MKSIFIKLSILLFSGVISAQIAIGKETPTEGAILDFGDDGNRGIVLPRIATTDLESATVPGTLYYDTSISKVMFKGSNTVDLSVKSVQSGNEFDITENGYNTYFENDNLQGMILGAITASAPGVLVLESTTKALILPKVDDYTSIGNPEAGTIAYDKTNKVLLVYDGEKWSFWGKKPITN